MLKKLVISLLCIIPTTTFMTPKERIPYTWLKQESRLELLKNVPLSDRSSIMRLTSERRTIQLFKSVSAHVLEANAILKSRLATIIPLLRKSNVLSRHEFIVSVDEFVQLGDDLELLQRQDRQNQ